MESGDPSRARISLSREIRYGWMACLIGTAAMDAVVILENAMTGQPVDTSFVLFGQLVGGVIAGFFIHILFGSALGIAFGIAISRIDALRIDSTAKGLKVGIAAGLITIPMGCVPFAVAVGVPITTMIPFVTVPHLVWGIVMGWLNGSIPCVLRVNVQCPDSLSTLIAFKVAQTRADLPGDASSL